jgi:hypothetical protein
MKSLTSLSALLLLTLLASCKKDAGTETPAKTIEDYLVKNNEITGWALGSSRWTANNITELTNRINGAAEIYRRHGFVEAASQDYRGTVNNNQATLTLTVFNQANKANASSLYNDPAVGFSGAITWTNGAGEAAQYLRNGGLSQQLCFYRNNFFVLLEISADTEESLNIAKQFALNVDAKTK